jgi:transcriptional regulator with XRE-family HTH domain
MSNDIDPKAQQLASNLLGQFRNYFDSARMQAGKSHKDIAYELGMSEQRLDKILTNPKMLTLQGLARIARTVDLNLFLSEK